MRFLLGLSLSLLLIAQLAAAQDADCPAGEDCSSAEDCTMFAMTTLAGADTACTGIESNQVCVAHGPVEATTFDEAQLTFATPGDTISLDSLSSLHLGALRPESDEWGIAMLRVPADEHGHDIFMLLAGAVEMRNSCSALLQQSVRIMLETDLRSGPGSHYASLARLPVGTELQVNACNCTGHWLRAVVADQQVGWIWAGSIEGLGDAAALPVVQQGTPVYGAMQAFCVRSGLGEGTCSERSEDGVLIQVPPEMGEGHLQVNQIEIGLTSTAFVQSQPGNQFELNVLDGSASVTLDGFTLEVPRGVRAVVPLNADNQPDGPARLELVDPAELAAVPTGLLPIPVDVSAALPETAPLIAGVEPCRVPPEQAPTACRVHFVNADAEAIQTLEVEFVSAPEGDWSGSIHDSPTLLEGDSTSGVLAWDATCSVGSTIFIGPVVWRLTLVDEHGHRSQPFEASFNCG